VGSELSIELVSHASVVIRCDGTRIWTDPWLFGSAFNNSWELLGPAPAPPADLDEIQFLWISHEHPDHFHIPTLRALPQTFKDRVTVLFQRLNSHKVFDAFEKMGYSHLVTLPSRKPIRPTRSACSVYCYPVGQMDSALGVAGDGVRVLNVNDAELDGRDCRIIRKDFGAPDAVLCQFSYAGYAGDPDHEARLTEMAEMQLQKVSEYARDLGATTSIPIASFMYFSRDDNRYMNAHMNRPSDLVRFFEPRRQGVVVLTPGESWTVGTPHDNAVAVKLWECEFDAVDEKEYVPSDSTGIDELAAAFHERVAHLRAKFPRSVLRALKPITVRLTDHDLCVRVCFGSDTFEVLDDPGAVADVEMNSQPFWFWLTQPFGMQSLGTTARYRLTGEGSFRNWRRHRIVFSLDNAEFYLRPSRSAWSGNADFIRTRFTILPHQMAYQLRRMR